MLSFAEAVKRKRECRQGWAGSGAGIRPATLLVGCYGLEDEVYHTLQQGMGQYGGDVQVYAWTDLSFAQQHALDIVLLDGTVHAELLGQLREALIVPVYAPKSLWKKHMKEYSPTKEEGYAIACTGNTCWDWFGACIRCMETRRFSYDWKTLLRRVWEWGAVQEISDDAIVEIDE